MIQVNILSDKIYSMAMQDNLPSKFPQLSFVNGEENIDHCEILCGSCSVDKINTLSSLKFQQLPSSGVDHIIRSYPQHIKYASASGAYNASISEHMLAMHLSLYRHLPMHRDFQNECIWQSWGTIPPVRLIKGSVVLVVGMGGIGGAYANLAKSMGAYVIGVRRSDLRKPDYADELHLATDLKLLLPRADVVAIATPLTAGTQQLIDKTAIDTMKDGAIILNIGRGSIIDTEAMCDALESGKLAGVGLDVTDPEPLPPEHRLWKIKNALITPHCSGGHGDNGITEGIYSIFKENLQRYTENVQLLNEVDFGTHYRKL